MITSETSRQIKYLMQIQKKAKLRREEKLFVAEGKKMVFEAGDRLKKAYVSQSFYDHLEEKAILESMDYELVSDKVMEAASDTTTPQGILALVQMPEYTLEEICGRKKQEEAVTLLLLEDLRDPGNLGTIMRTAEGAGVDGVILSRDSVDLFNPKTVRSTMGSIYRMPFFYTEDFQETLLKLKSQGICLYATHLSGKNEYDRENYTKSCGILIGNEARGLKEETAALADKKIRIPMEGSVESLNAAVAAAVLLYEVYRQRRRE